MTEKQFIEFATQNTDNGEITNGFQDIKTGEWYYTKDSENAKKICELLNELNDENQFIKHAINEALSAERTELGKSVLKQLKQQIEVR